MTDCSPAFACFSASPAMQSRSEPRRPFIRIQLGEDCVLRFEGRDAWALHQLIRAGASGCTPIDNPAPRWSHYVFKLRRGGLDIETVNEAHGGPFAGQHARYVLRSPVTILEHRMTGYSPQFDGTRATAMVTASS
jgi:hypothetical protein